MQTETTKEVLIADLLPERISRRRMALGRGLGALLMRARLGTAARQMPALQLPTWASGFEPHQKQWLKKVLSKGRKV